ncbi:GxxExxY protein [Rubritalea tangerina]|uniref:GxxExxY protein n=1 Tax=Rubritalea tangerina TaxID=430798 RepID=A0ABW4Z659_9BACT
MEAFPHKELSYEIIGASMEVHRTLKPGLDEKLYERALIIELNKRGLHAAQQKQFPVNYKGTAIGTLIPDLIVDDKIIVDAKVVSEFCSAHISQMLGYLNITDLEVALLINFKNASLEHQRVFKKL